MKGFIAYKGKSLLDNQPIVGIVTLSTKNVKTGDMPQLWIIREDVSPTDAVKSKKDTSVCGNCIHKHNNGGACYVQPFHAPLSVYKAYKRGLYDGNYDKGIQALAGRKIRLGAYGDPAMLPDEVLSTLTQSAAGHTGYTHQWKNKRLRHALKYCQASVDTDKDLEKLKTIAPNANYFRVATDYDNLKSNEIICPAESGSNCIDCMLCNGTTKNIVIKVHGMKSKRFNPEINVKEI